MKKFLSKSFAWSALMSILIAGCALLWVIGEFIYTYFSDHKFNWHSMYILGGAFGSFLLWAFLLEFITRNNDVNT